MKKIIRLAAMLLVSVSLCLGCEPEKISGGKSNDDNSGNYSGDNGGAQEGDQGGEQGGEGDVNYTLCEAWTAAYHGRGYVEALEENLDIIGVSNVTDDYFVFDINTMEYSGDDLVAFLDDLVEYNINHDYIYQGPDDWEAYGEEDGANLTGEYYVYIVGVKFEGEDFVNTGNYNVVKININGSAYDNAYGDLDEYDWSGGEGGEEDIEIEAPASWTLKSDWKAEYVGYEEEYDWYYISYTGVTDDYWTYGIWDQYFTSKEDLDNYLLYDAEYAILYPEYYMSYGPDYDWSYVDGYDYDTVLPGENYVYIIGIDYENDAVTGNYGVVKLNMSQSVVYDGRYDEYFDYGDDDIDYFSLKSNSHILRFKGGNRNIVSKKFNKPAKAAKMLSRKKHVRVLAK